ncbi:MAG: tetratricopeptide repeat protein [Deltaproteobacteria bacterium]|nr:tetratricopeptide repeat protein [Deltaproteobacteria bacterium]
MTGYTRNIIKLLCAGILLSAVFLAALPAFAVNPDKLYREGRFAQAEEAYSRNDMDHPQNLRYRFNKGCAAFQNSDYEKALSAFSSVLRRAGDDGMRFKAAYNFGNTSFEMNDFNAAAAFYKKALIYDPANEDARYNLELSLRELKAREGQKKEDQQDKSGREKQSEDQNHPQDGKQETGDKEGEQKEKQDKSGERESGQGEAESQDLSGDLKAAGQPPPKETDEQAAKEAAAAMDRKKAEALLDNIKEDRSKLMQFMSSKEKKRGTGSGKDW